LRSRGVFQIPNSDFFSVRQILRFFIFFREKIIQKNSFTFFRPFSATDFPFISPHGRMFREEHHERKLPHTGILFRRLVGGGVTHFCHDAEGTQMMKVRLVALSSL
jgi:hypothetical protein